MENFKKNPIKILLADDDPDDRELFSDTIKDVSANANLIVFEDGKTLLSHLNNNSSDKPDLIFLDINMPFMCGKECLKEIRKSNEFKNVPVVVFSTSANDNDIYETFKHGANLFITKPGSYNEQVDLFHRFFHLFSTGKLLDRTMSSFVLIPTVSISYRLQLGG
jgi:CheY-like chemotaxis protein